MAKKGGLGLGLSELLSDIKSVDSSDDQKNGKSALRSLAIDRLKPGKYQPRRDMDQEALAELADSIRIQGVIQPIMVRPTLDGSYEIIAGERRWRAAQLANLHEVPVVIREIPDKQVIALSLIENIQREDLNAIEIALSLQRLIDEFSMTHENAALAIGRSRTAVSNLLRLLELPVEIKNMLQQRLLDMGHARALLVLSSAKQIAAAKIVIAKKLSVRATETLVNQLQQPKSTAKSFIDPNTTQVQKWLADRLATSVKIHHTKKGQGKVVIKYNSLDELDGILKHIR